MFGDCDVLCYFHFCLFRVLFHSRPLHENDWKADVRTTRGIPIGGSKQTSAYKRAKLSFLYSLILSSLLIQSSFPFCGFRARNSLRER